MSEIKKNHDVLEDRWMGIEEIAAYLGVTAATIRTWTKKDDPIPAHKIGKLWKFKKDEVDYWVKSGDAGNM